MPNSSKPFKFIALILLLCLGFDHIKSVHAATPGYWSGRVHVSCTSPYSASIASQSPTEMADQGCVNRRLNSACNPFNDPLPDSPPSIFVRMNGPFEYHYRCTNDSSEERFTGWVTFIQAPAFKERGPSCFGVGNPINSVNGNKYQELRLIERSQNRQGVPISLYYNSMVDLEVKAFGKVWRHSYESRLFPESITLRPNATFVHRPTGKVVGFDKVNGGWVAPPGSTEELRELVNTSGETVGWHYITGANSLEIYDSKGILQTVIEAGGDVTQLRYSTGVVGTLNDYLVDNAGIITSELAPKGLLVGISKNTNQDGIVLFYNNKRQVVKIKDASGSDYHFEYGGASAILNGAHSSSTADILTSVKYPDTQLKVLFYNEQDKTANTSIPTALTGIVDENSSRYSTWFYNSSGKAISSENGSGKSKYSVAYLTQYSTGENRVTDPLGSQRNVKFTQVRGELRFAGQSQPAGSGCNASTSSVVYDIYTSNKSSEDDFNGKRTCFTHVPERNLESVRVEGLNGGSTGTKCSNVTPGSGPIPSGSRKVSTQWHPDWKLKSRIAEPGKITTLVYNGQPDPTAGNVVASCAPTSALLPNGKPIAVLCKKVEQATTDLNGASGFAAASQAGVVARIWRYTYNNFGQVLTEDGPRTDVNDITTYTYHDTTSFTGNDPNSIGFTIGDLKTVTNAAGKVTQYTKYNKHGQLLESIDPNGVVSSFTYDPRQRMLSSTVGGQTTSYTYDAVGQLKRTTRPDTSWVGHDYDDAHRLIATYDNFGNRVDYTLDNAGNKIAENVKDPSGALRKQLARSIDALGRVQQITGRE